MSLHGLPRQWQIVILDPLLVRWIGTDVLVGGGDVLVGGGIVFVGMGGSVLVEAGGRVLISVGGNVIVLIGINVAACWDCEEDGLVSVPCRIRKEVGDSAIPGVEESLLESVELSSPNSAIKVATASSGLTGVISCCEQKLPVKVQARVNSSGESGWGTDGGLMADVPSVPAQVHAGALPGCHDLVSVHST